MMLSAGAAVAQGSISVPGLAVSAWMLHKCFCKLCKTQPSWPLPYCTRTPCGLQFLAESVLGQTHGCLSATMASLDPWVLELMMVILTTPETLVWIGK